MIIYGENYMPPAIYYEVENVSDASYNFTLNSNEYYESTNKGKDSTAALCKLKFITDTGKIILDYINSGENDYDFGIISNLDTTLTTSYSVDTSNVYRSFKGSSSMSMYSLEIPVSDSDEHFIYIKYRKKIVQLVPEMTVSNLK